MHNSYIPNASSDGHPAPARQRNTKTNEHNAMNTDSRMDNRNAAQPSGERGHEMARGRPEVVVGIGGSRFRQTAGVRPWLTASRLTRGREDKRTQRHMDEKKIPRTERREDRRTGGRKDTQTGKQEDGREDTMTIRYEDEEMGLGERGEGRGSMRSSHVHRPGGVRTMGPPRFRNTWQVPPELLHRM